MHLNPADTVLIISPAGRVRHSHIDHAIRVLNSWGLKVELGRYAKAEFYNFAGTLEERLADLQWALDHPYAKAILASRGGYGTLQLLDKIDWSIFQQKPKLFVGYSDITTLQVQINNMGIASLHALMPNSYPKGTGEHQASLQTLEKALFHRPYAIAWENTVSIQPMSIDAEVIGGNLSILYSLQGTPYAPNYKDKILFIEEVSEYLYHTDRMLRSMDYAGVFAQLKAILVGDFTSMKDNALPFGQSVEQMLADIAQKHNVPVCFGLPCGHGDPTLALPLGEKGLLKLDAKHCHLSF